MLTTCVGSCFAGAKAMTFPPMTCACLDEALPDRVPPPIPPTAPTVVSSEYINVPGNRIDVRFDQTLQATPFPPASAFTLNLAGNPTVRVVATQINGNTVILTLNTAPTFTTGTVSYTPPMYDYVKGETGVKVAEFKNNNILP